MFTIPNYKEFYPKALIPMRDYDQQNFCIEYCNDCEHCIKAKHWLIALEGSSIAEQKNKYEWKVVVYPANESGVFWALNGPYYKSLKLATFSAAYEESKSVIQKIKEAKLTAEWMA